MNKCKWCGKEYTGYKYGLCCSAECQKKWNIYKKNFSDVSIYNKDAHLQKQVLGYFEDNHSQNDYAWYDGYYD